MATPGVSVRVVGPTQQIAEMSRRLKGAPPEVRRELFRVVGGALKEVTDEAKTAADRVSWDLPGGLTGHPLSAGITQRSRTAGRGAGGEVGYLKPGGTSSTAKSINRDGTVRHPLFGDRRYWFNTQVGDAGWFTDATRRATPAAIRELNLRMYVFVKRILDTGISYKVR